MDGSKLWNNFGMKYLTSCNTIKTTALPDTANAGQSQPLSKGTYLLMAKKNLPTPNCLSSRKRAVGYVRVSTDEQAREGVSLETQRQKVEEYARLHDLDLMIIIEDAGRSAKNLNRPGVQKLLRMARKREVDAIIIYKLDRLFRSVKDAANTAEDNFNRNGVGIHSITEKLDTQSAMGELFFNILASFAQMERKVASERTKAALAHKRTNGEKCGGSVPFGFDAANGRLIPNGDEQGTLKRIKELRQKGRSYQEIANALNATRCTTKQGKAWQWHSVNRVLQTAKRREVEELAA